MNGDNAPPTGLLGDFGLSVYLKESGKKWAGTGYYTSPDCAKDYLNECYIPKTSHDVYSFGLALWKILNGEWKTVDGKKELLDPPFLTKFKGTNRSDFLNYISKITYDEIKKDLFSTLSKDQNEERVRKLIIFCLAPTDRERPDMIYVSKELDAILARGIVPAILRFVKGLCSACYGPNGRDG